MNTGKKPADAARYAEIDKGYFSNLRHGSKTKPSQEVLVALAQFFGCDEEWLRTGVGQPSLSGMVVREEIMGPLREGVPGAARRMPVYELIKEIQMHAQLLSQGKPKYLLGAYASQIADLATELAEKSGWTALIKGHDKKPQTYR